MENDYVTMSEVQWRGFCHVWAAFMTMQKEKAEEIVRMMDAELNKPLEGMITEEAAQKLNASTADSVAAGLDAARLALMKLKNRGQFKVIFEGKELPTQP